MPANVNRRIHLTRLPVGKPLDSDFRFEDAPIAKPAEGEVLLRTIYLSLDPYQRTWMMGKTNYGYFAASGVVVIGRAVSEVVESRDPRFTAGEFVYGETGWQSNPTVKSDLLNKIDRSLGPISTFVGVLGSPGLTAWVGMLDICDPKPGMTVVVSSAAGAVGSVAGQIARIRGARVVGVAGARDKCRFAVDELGYDVCISHRSKDLPGELARACPNGINAYFDNTGGPITDAVFELMRSHVRIALCGLVAEYNMPDPRGPNMKHALFSQARIEAFSVRENLHRMADYRRDASSWMKAGQLRYKEEILQGIDNMPHALQGMLEGSNFGKLLVQVGEDNSK